MLIILGDQWSLRYEIPSKSDDETITSLSWGSVNELLVANCLLTLWSFDNDLKTIWKQSLANPAKLASFSHDASLIASTGQHDRMTKIWRRLSFGSDDERFDVTYLPHPAVVTGMHWRKPYSREQSIENVLYTICADQKVRIWTATEPHSLQVLQLWGQIDLQGSIQPRDFEPQTLTKRRYFFVVESKDFITATTKAVQTHSSNAKTAQKHALEHLIEVANRSPEICIVLDGRGHMSAWGLENVGCKTRKPTDIFHILHVEGLQLRFGHEVQAKEDYAQFLSFCTDGLEGILVLLTHHLDGRIAWMEGKIEEVFDPASRAHRLTEKALWSGHDSAIQKLVRNASGKALFSRTSHNEGLVWKQQPAASGIALIRHSACHGLNHVHRTCLLDEGDFIINLHHDCISLWDTRTYRATHIASCDFQLQGKPLCLIILPSAEKSPDLLYVATICTSMKGLAWEVYLPRTHPSSNSMNEGERTYLRQFCVFDLGLDDCLSFVLPIDPAGPQTTVLGSLDVFASDIAISYTHSGVLRTWTVKVDPLRETVDWLVTSTIETGIDTPSLASGSSIRKTALVSSSRTSLTIWDTRSAQLEYEEQFPDRDMIQDLDWTSTPDNQSILAVGFPHRVLLLSQLRYDYLDAGPAWASIREIRIHDLTSHPIGDSCWLDSGNLVIGTGNQLFIYNKEVEADDKSVSDLKLHNCHGVSKDLFDVVNHVNGTLPVFHPQFLAQCIVMGKTSVVHRVIVKLHKVAKFFTDGDDVDSFLNLSLDGFFAESDTSASLGWKEMRSSYVNFGADDEPDTVNETLAAALNEKLSKVALPQLSSREQFHLVDIIECVATVEKHRRSMDDNAARFLLFFRQHIIRASQHLGVKAPISWREIIWAFHSGSQDILIDLVSRQYRGKMLWEHARQSGMFMWMTDTTALVSINPARH